MIECSLQALQTLKRLSNELKRALGSLCPRHFALELVSILEEQLNVNVLGKGVITQQSCKNLEAVRERFRRDSLKNFVHLIN